MGNANFVQYMSPINGIVIDVPADEDQMHELLNHPDKQMFLRPIDDVPTLSAGNESASKKRKTKAVVELE